MLLCGLMERNKQGMFLYIIGKSVLTTETAALDSAAEHLTRAAEHLTHHFHWACHAHIMATMACFSSGPEAQKWFCSTENMLRVYF